jgi:Flp pilus assembly protein TadD
LSAAGALQAASAAESTDAAHWRDRAEHAARRAIALTTERASAWASLGDALAARALASHEPALADSTERAYSYAAMLAPADGWLLVAHARFELARRDGVRALLIAQRLTGLYPEAALGHTLAGTALLLLERPGEARAAFQQALAARWEQDAASQRTAVEALVKRLPAGRAVTRPAVSEPRHRRR